MFFLIPMLFEFILFAHLIATALMLGIVWFVQIIHYPLFAMVDGEGFKKYEQEHIRKTKFLIMPAMLIELFTGIFLVVMSNVSTNLFWINLTLLIVIWASTFLVQVPLHSRLSENKNQDNINKLVNSNWIRTVLWSMRTILLIGILVFEI